MIALIVEWNIAMIGKVIILHIWWLLCEENEKCQTIAFITNYFRAACNDFVTIIDNFLCKQNLNATKIR